MGEEEGEVVGDGDKYTEETFSTLLCTLFALRGLVSSSACLLLNLRQAKSFSRTLLVNSTNIIPLAAP